MAQRVGKVIALLFHDCGTRRGWVVSSTPRPHFTPGKDPVPIVQEAGCAPGPSGEVENLVPTRIRSQTVQPVVSPYTDWANGPTFYIYIYIYIHIFQSDDVSQSLVTADEADGTGSTAVGLLKIRLHVVCETRQGIKDHSDESFYYSANWGLLALALEPRNSISRMAGSFEISKLDTHTHIHTHTQTHTYTCARKVYFSSPWPPKKTELVNSSTQLIKSLRASPYCCLLACKWDTQIDEMSSQCWSVSVLTFIGREIVQHSNQREGTAAALQS